MSDLILSPIPVRPCIKCGATERYKNGDCKACSKATGAVCNMQKSAKHPVDFMQSRGFLL